MTEIRSLTMWSRTSRDATLRPTGLSSFRVRIRATRYDLAMSKTVENDTADSHAQLVDDLSLGLQRSYTS